MARPLLTALANHLLRRVRPLCTLPAAPLASPHAGSHLAPSAPCPPPPLQLNHIVNDTALFANDFEDGQELETMGGSKITVGAGSVRFWVAPFAAFAL